MAFLLDGLHEDLNRITNKPYINQEDAPENTADSVRLLPSFFLMSWNINSNILIFQKHQLSVFAFVFLAYFLKLKLTSSFLQVAAQRAWDNHKKRNDSIITDLFHGNI